MNAQNECRVQTSLEQLRQSSPYWGDVKLPASDTRLGTQAHAIALEALTAIQRSHGYGVRVTSLERAKWIEAAAAAGAAPASVHMKMESEQLSGSFKLRGALNALLAASEQPGQQGQQRSGEGRGPKEQRQQQEQDQRCKQRDLQQQDIKPELRQQVQQGECSSTGQGLGMSQQHAAGSISRSMQSGMGSMQPSSHSSPMAPHAVRICTASTGNHALACLHALELVQLKAAAAAAAGGHVGGTTAGSTAVGDTALSGTTTSSTAVSSTVQPALQVYVSRAASQHKVDKLRALGAEVIVHGDDCVEAEEAARTAAESSGGSMRYISPYNDVHVAGGQGTLAYEMLMQTRGSVDVVYVPVGGGGLIAGVASLIKALHPQVRVVGCQPAVSDVMRASVAAGHIVHAPPHATTLSDATAGGIEEGAITLEPCMRCVDAWEVVDEDEIAHALLHLLAAQSKLVEGAAGCALAAVRRDAQRGLLAGKHAVVVCCGGNIGIGTLQALLAKHA